MSRYCSQIVTVLGMIVLVIGVVTIYHIVPKIEEKLYNEIVSLENGSYTFEHWKNPKIPDILRVYFFQVRNQDTMLNENEYSVREVGPYVYHKYDRKTIISLNDKEDTMTYVRKTVFFFNETESGDRKDTDVVTVLDPLVAAYLQEYARFPEYRQPTPVPTAVWYGRKGDHENSNVSSPDDGRLFITTTVRDFLFGERYFEKPTDPNDTSWDSFSAIMDKMKGAYLRSHDSDSYGFSIIKWRNNTFSPRIVIRRGTFHKLSKGTVVSYGNKTKMSTWGSHVCDMINGTNMSVLPSMSKIPKMIYSFAFIFCRSIRHKFRKMGNVFGLTGAKFARDKSYMELSEENECFCPHYGDSRNSHCPPNGVMSLKKCYGIDLFHSEPHFYNANPNLYEHDTKGLAPRRSRHESHTVVEPKSGVILLKKSYFQINAKFTQDEWGPYYARLRSGIYPILWFEEEYRVPPEEKERLGEVFQTIHLMYIVKWFLVILGMVLLILSVVIVMYEEEIICTKRRSEKIKLSVFQMRNRRTR